MLFDHPFKEALLRIQKHNGVCRKRVAAATPTICAHGQAAREALQEEAQVSGLRRTRRIDVITALIRLWRHMFSGGGRAAMELLGQWDKVADQVGEYRNQRRNQATLHVFEQGQRSTQRCLRTTCSVIMASDCPDAALDRVTNYLLDGSDATSWVNIASDAQNVVDGIPYPRSGRAPEFMKSSLKLVHWNKQLALAKEQIALQTALMEKRDQELARAKDQITAMQAMQARKDAELRELRDEVGHLRRLAATVEKYDVDEGMSTFVEDCEVEGAVERVARERNAGAVRLNYT